FKSIDEFFNNVPAGSVIATNINIKQKPIKIENYTPGNLDINVSLRGNHTLYVYAKDNLNLEITKQDINWYKNEDTMVVKISDMAGNLIREELLPDDGEAEASKITKTAQTRKINIPNIKEGVYRIDLLNNADTFIRRIKINQSKLVVQNKIFPVDNKLYKITETKPLRIYTKYEMDYKIDFSTAHREGLQDVMINNRIFKIEDKHKTLSYLMKGHKNLIEIYLPKNDISVTVPGYFSFTKDSYFEPFDYYVTSLENYKDADYIYTDYKEPIIDGDWMIGEVTFDIKEVYVKDGKLSIMLNARHLRDEKYKSYTIPVDWIKVTLHRGPK
ncbi:MAG: hypothetical protein N3E50_04165, partial [Candidatus Goldbacteria bacterium]|nr:hypothetical protein [Candidatus Goldiibacteriota bacterium]